MSIVSVLLSGTACVLAVPVMTYAVEIGVAMPKPKIKPRRTFAKRPSVAIVIPAYNESVVVIPAIRDSLEQAGRPGDRVIVVADNCDDDTAEVARAAGAEVIERFDPTKRGKSYALEYGIQHLAKTGPTEVVIFVDADCRLSPGSVDELATLSAQTMRPVQAGYLLRAPRNGSAQAHLAEFALVVKNSLRPLGLKRMGGPCQMVGSGMALAWPLFSKFTLANGSTVEDMNMGLDLALVGHPPLYCPEAVIGSTFPETAIGEETQRRRWHEGHLSMMTLGLKVLGRGFLRRQPATVVQALDVLVPPLTLLAMLLAGFLTLSGAVWLLGGPAIGLILALALCAVFSLATFGAWYRGGRPTPSLAQMSRFVADRGLLYGRFARGDRAVEWVRTDRTHTS